MLFDDNGGSTWLYMPLPSSFLPQIRPLYIQGTSVLSWFFFRICCCLSLALLKTSLQTMILSWNDSGCTRFRNIWISFCMWRVWANWYTCSTNCTSRTAKFGFSSNPCSFHTSSNFAIQLSDGSGFETPTHNVESENTWIFVLIFFLAR